MNIIRRINESLTGILIISSVLHFPTGNGLESNHFDEHIHQYIDFYNDKIDLSRHFMVSGTLIANEKPDSIIYAGPNPNNENENIYFIDVSSVNING